MSRLPVYTEAAGGGDRIWLDDLGEVSSLRISTDMHGDLGATWSLRLDSRSYHRALYAGRRVTIPISATSNWQGTLQSPQRGDLWQCTATGRPAEANTFYALAATSNNALKLDEVVDAAIGRGWGVTRPSALPTMTGQQDSGSLTVAAALDTVTSAKSQWWSVNRNLQLVSAALPTSLSYLIEATDTAGGRTITDFITDVLVTYSDAATYNATATLTRSSTPRPFGRVEEPLDLTDKGWISTADAQAKADSFLKDHAARLRFTNPFTLPFGSLLNPGGQPVDLATATANSLVRITLVDPDSAAGELALGAVQLVIGQTDYDVDADVLAATPLDVSQKGLAGLFVKRAS